MIKYNVEVTGETTNLMRAIEEQHQVQLTCEEIVAVEPQLNVCNATGTVHEKVKEKTWVTVTLNDANKHMFH